MEPKSPSKAKLPVLGFFHHFRVLKLGIAIVVILLLILIGHYLARNLGFAKYSSYFTVVIDCGSSGTRVNVYELKSNDGVTTNRNPKLPILLNSFPNNSTKIDDRKDGCAYHCLQTEPGLDKLVGNYSGVKASLEPLIRRAEKWVPYERHKLTPIFVLATAGLRRLDDDIAREVLDNVEAVVKLHKFKYKKDWIRVLSGKEEAYYGWIALNYHMGVFNSSRSSTLGLLDLGGSSLQVATEIQDPTVGVFRSKIGSFEHPIMAASLPDLGLNEAFDRTVVMLSHSQGDSKSSEIRHPCLKYGFIKNYSCFEGNLSSKMREKNISSFYLVGEPNWEKCKRLARAAAINSSSLSDDSYCTRLSSRNGEKIRFHALSGFFAVYNLLNLKTTTNVSKIWEKGEDLCSRLLSGLTNMPINKKYADFLCFRVPYMVSLIEKVVCVGDRDIIFGPGDVSWTLGAGLVAGEDLWASERALSFASYLRFKRVMISPYFLFFVLAMILLVVYRSQIKLPMLGRKATSFNRPKHRPV